MKTCNIQYILKYMTRYILKLILKRMGGRYVETHITTYEVHMMSTDLIPQRSMMKKTNSVDNATYYST